MVFAVNPPATGNTLLAFQAKAIALGTNTTTPPVSPGGSGGSYGRGMVRRSVPRAILAKDEQ